MSIPKNYDLGMLTSSFVPPKKTTIQLMDIEKKRLIKEAVKRLKDYQRREYIAHISLEYFNRNARRTEREMGWGRECIQKGLKEKETGIRCIDNYRASGRRRT
ncbi:MAG: hypothetical protein GQ581_03455 [Methyloprofundus sp.]|nr:hypothetical protein [Methyloprofundus sp.]